MPPAPSPAAAEAPPPWLATSRALGAELLGTFALVFVAAGGDVIKQVSGGEVSYVAHAAAPGLLVAAMIYALGNVSGAHFNPVATLAFAARGVFPWRQVPGYWLIQLAGSWLAAAFLRGLFGAAIGAGMTRPAGDPLVSLAMEIALTLLLVTVILGTATRHQVLGPEAAIAVGATVMFCGLFAKPISGASMNPARSFGPALAAGDTGTLWIYFLGPALGALVAVAFTWLLRGGEKPEEPEAAQGDQPK